MESGGGPLISASLEEENEQLRERVEALAAELDDRLEDDERERDATRRLFWRD